MKQIFYNRKARFNYTIELKYNTGIVLVGTEVKSIRDGLINFGDSFCLFINNELWIRNLTISEYKFGNSHNPIQDRKLLLHKKELNKIKNIIKEKGYTIFPLEIFFNEKNIVKLVIGVGKGKKSYDKRETIKKRESDREIKKHVSV